LVIGRDFFFEAVAAAAQPVSRVRGVRVKRNDVGQGTTGLSFSLDLLGLTLRRNPGAHRVIRIGFEPPYGDLIDDIRLRAGLRGLEIPPVAAGAGAAPGQTTLEASINDRARTLAMQLNAAADSNAQLLWFAFDNPPVGLTEGERLSFEAFIGAALRMPRLRLVLAGYETIASPGEESDSPADANVDGPPLLLVEHLGLFQRQDVKQLLDRACRDFGLEPDAGEINGRVDEILLGLNSINGQYSTGDLETVRDRAVRDLEYFRAKAEASLA
jgi:hypothetical protein